VQFKLNFGHPGQSARAGASRHAAAGVLPPCPSASGPHGRLAARPRRHHRVHVSLDRIPLRARSNPCMAARRRPGRTPRRVPRRRRPVRIGHRALPLNSPPRAPRQCPHSSSCARLPIKGSPGHLCTHPPPSARPPLPPPW
jgi:hypothetical protein